MAGYDLKNEEDVKEYLKNLYTEYKFGCFSEKNPEVCHLLGDYEEALKQDFKKAANIYFRNCTDFNYGRSCAKYGTYKLIGKGCEKNAEEAYKCMKKGCELDDENGCTNAGIVGISLKDIHTEANRVKTIEEGMSMLKKSCEKFKSQRSCFFLSGFYYKGIEGVFDVNLVEAYRYSLKACEFGNPYACRNISTMHYKGQGAQKDEKLAETFKNRALELEKDMKETKPTLKFGQGIQV